MSVAEATTAEDVLEHRTPEQRAAIEQRLSELERDGRLSPETVVAEAKDEDSPFHVCFPWDVDEAAEQHWIYLARRLIRSVKYTYHTETTEVVVSRYMHDPDSPPGTQGYLSVPRILKKKDLARRALIQEFERTESSLRRASSYAQVFGLESDVDDLARRVGRVVRKVERK